MSEPQVAPENKRKSLAKGLIAGLIGGLAGTVARTYAERIFPPHRQIGPKPLDLSVESMDEDALSPVAKTGRNQAVRWGYGGAVGAAYGVVAEFYPEATAKRGASFGLALEALDREAKLFPPGAAAEAGDVTPRESGSEIASHVVYGVATELVRRLVRRWL